MRCCARRVCGVSCEGATRQRFAVFSFVLLLSILFTTVRPLAFALPPEHASPSTPDASALAEVRYAEAFPRGAEES